MYKRDSRRTRVQQRHNRGLVDRNAENDVVEATTEAFREYGRYKDVNHAITYLESMKGVGIKMATLTLASAFPEEIPFFSHELSEWICPDDLIDRMRKDGHYVTAAEVEKVAFVAMASKHMQAKRLSDGSVQLDRHNVLGHGGGCEGVYQGVLHQSTHIDKAVAVKIVSGMNARVRYLETLDEITILAMYKEDHLVDFHGWMFWDGHFHLAMELMTCDLETYLHRGYGGNIRTGSWKNRQPLTPLQKPMRQLLAGLEALHCSGIAHRDLRPKNIFLDGRANLKIGDFGISKHTIGGQDLAAMVAPETWGYTAPEMARAVKSSDLAISTKVDIWSLGCIMYRMLVGKPLFISLADIKVNLESKLETLQTLRYSRLGITSSCIDFIKGLLCEKQNHRFDVVQAYKHAWIQEYRGSGPKR